MNRAGSRRVIACSVAVAALLSLATLPAADGAERGVPARVPSVPLVAAEPPLLDLEELPIEAGSGLPAMPPAPPLARASTELDDATLLRLAHENPAALGPLSIGTPDAGLLINPVPLPDGPLWTIRNRAEAYATTETIEFLRVAIRSVADRYPGSPRVVIGDLSRPDGGRLDRHRSHQVGRDVDVGFFYRSGQVADFQTARQRDLDLPRTWALVRALITETDVERIFIDRSLIRVLYAYALASGEDREWLDDVFGRLGEEHKGIIQHEKRHKNHMHVRFYNRTAQERGRLAYPVLVQDGNAPPPTIRHRVARGETLGHLARRFGASASAIRAANRLSGSRLRAGRAYLIPVRRVPDSGPTVVPPRRLPPHVVPRLAAQDPASAATGEAIDDTRR
jgi:murein endopeptidase